MARYVTLINFSEQGIKTIKDWDKRVATTRERFQRAGGRLVDVYLTFGDFDAVAIAEWPSDDLALRAALEYGIGGDGPPPPGARRPPGQGAPGAPPHDPPPRA